jgi:hypothetical protein
MKELTIEQRLEQIRFIRLISGTICKILPECTIYADIIDLEMLARLEKVIKSKEFLETIPECQTTNESTHLYLDSFKIPRCSVVGSVDKLIEQVKNYNESINTSTTNLPSKIST